MKIFLPKPASETDDNDSSSSSGEEEVELERASKNDVVAES